MSKPRALDLFCGAGGATRGLQLAGFHVTGVDHKPQQRYCGDVFYQADALAFDSIAREWGFIWASPPCQAFTNAQRIRHYQHPDLISAVRDMLVWCRSGHYCIENVVGATLRNPVMLCGPMFGLRTYRHRLFECSFPIEQPWHAPHTAPQAKMGRPPKDGEFIQVVGNFSNVSAGREAMGIDWMMRDELSEAIPPAYAEFIGKAALQYIQQRNAA